MAGGRVGLAREKVKQKKRRKEMAGPVAENERKREIKGVGRANGKWDEKKKEIEESERRIQSSV